jgi:phage terminase large subunit-like protein
MCPPAWGTRRRPERATWGPAVGRIAAKIGKPFMPWQQHVMDIALEIDPETGFLAYREVNLGVPRQSGKTTPTLARAIWRAEAQRHLGGRQKMLYAAQTGKDAKAKWQDDFLEDLASAKVMRGRYRAILSTGRERVRFLNGSTFAPIATQSTSGHGNTLDDGTLDEAFAQLTNIVEAAWRPAMITRPNAQFWVMSTAGTYKSVYWRSKINRARAIAEAGQPSRTAVFEWGAPKDADPEDPATWQACMPALGHTIRIEDIRHEFETIEGGLPEFRRAYLNQWADEFDDTDWVLPKASWRACLDEASVRAGVPALALDVAPDRSHAAVSMAALRADGLPMVKVVRHGEGATWAPKHIADLARVKNASVVVLDGVGPASNLRADVEEALEGCCPLRVMTGPEVADACSDIQDSVLTEQLRHTGQTELDMALAGATLRPLGERKAWDRRHSTSDITPLVSATYALWALAKIKDTEAWGFFE